MPRILQAAQPEARREVDQGFGQKHTTSFSVVRSCSHPRLRRLLSPPFLQLALASCSSCLPLAWVSFTPTSVMFSCVPPTRPFPGPVVVRSWARHSFMVRTRCLSHPRPVALNFHHTCHLRCPLPCCYALPHHSPGRCCLPCRLWRIFAHLRTTSTTGGDRQYKQLKRRSSL